MNTFSLVQKFSHDLKNIDISLIKKNFEIFDAIEDEQKRYIELARLCAEKQMYHPEWSNLAGRIKIHQIKMTCGKTFSETTEMAKLFLHESYYKFVMKNKKRLDKIICEDRDDLFDWFGACTCIQSYLLIKDGVIIESPQQMLLRVAVWIWMSREPTNTKELHKFMESILAQIKDEKKREETRKFLLTKFDNTEYHIDVLEQKFTTNQVFEKITEVYDDLSLKNYVQASPTLFNSGTTKPQLSSCFLKTTPDNLPGIANSWIQTTLISGSAGGIGTDIGRIRHSAIGNARKSSGVTPLLKVDNQLVEYVDQKGRRPGSEAIYTPTWHVDVLEVIELKRPTGAENKRARNLFYALWVDDLFMKRVKEDGVYSLFCPNIAKGLNETFGEDFEKLYISYERKKMYEKQIKARDLWYSIYISWVETGTPYILFKDAINRKVNQKNLGIIRSSNLCAEITEYTDDKEVASCNLANIVLKSCVNVLQTPEGNNSVFNFSKLERLTRSLVRNLNRVIDINYYIKEIPEIKYSNLRHRPIAIGVQGLADVFAMLDLHWEHKDARILNSLIFETMYYAAIDESRKMARERKVRKETQISQLKTMYREIIDKMPLEQVQKEQAKIMKKIKHLEKLNPIYETFQGSPASRGLLQFDLWAIEKLSKKIGVSFAEIEKNIDQYKNQLDYTYEINGEKMSYLSGKYDWEKLRQNVIQDGMVNSLLIALMPTASTSHLFGSNDCFEPFHGMIFSRKVLSGHFMLVNKYMVQDFEKMGIWNHDMASDIVAQNGSIQDLDLQDYIENPSKEALERFEYLKLKYKTAYEVSQKTTAQFGIDRARFVCQTQSFNCFMSEPTYAKMTSFIFFQWENGAKTALYYLRSDASAQALKNKTNKKRTKQETIKKYVCTDEICVACQ